MTLLAINSLGSAELSVRFSYSCARSRSDMLALWTTIPIKQNFLPTPRTPQPPDGLEQVRLHVNGITLQFTGRTVTFPFEEARTWDTNDRVCDIYRGRIDDDSSVFFEWPTIGTPYDFFWNHARVGYEIDNVFEVFGVVHPSGIELLRSVQQ